MSAIYTPPRVCLGHFNEILYHWEKVAKRMAGLFRMTAFGDFLSACNLMDLESNGCAFTWANNQEGQELVKKKLDMTVCNIKWRVYEAEVFALLAIGLDHSSLLLSLLAEKTERESF